MRRGGRSTRRESGLTTSGGAFLPNQLTGCVLWLRADQGTHIGTGVSQWDDKSGTGDSNKNVTQATGSKQPTLSTSDASYNNQATLHFASASQQMLRSGTWSTALAQPSTAIVVGHWTVNTSQRLLDGLAAHTLEFLDNGANSGWSLDAGTQLASASNAGGGVPAVWAGTFNGASSKGYKNNSQSAQFTGNAGSASATGITVGAEGNLGNPLNGTIAEVIIYNRVLSSAELQKVFLYAGPRYNISTS